MRLRKSIAIAISALGLSTGAAFAGEGPLTDRSDPLGYQPHAYAPIDQDRAIWSNEMSAAEELSMQDYEVYDVYIVPYDAIVLVPSEEDLVQPPVRADELG